MGVMHGKGIYRWPDGTTYEGDFACNAITGVGKYSWADGSVYEGDVVNGVRFVITYQSMLTLCSIALQTRPWNLAKSSTAVHL